MSCIDPKAYAVEGGWAHLVAKHIHQEKMKITQLVLIELGQLIAFMESVIGQQEAKEEARADAPSSEETSGKDSARGESGATE